MSNQSIRDRAAFLHHTELARLLPRGRAQRLAATAAGILFALFIWDAGRAVISGDTGRASTTQGPGERAGALQSAGSHGSSAAEMKFAGLAAGLFRPIVNTRADVLSEQELDDALHGTVTDVKPIKLPKKAARGKVLRATEAEAEQVSGAQLYRAVRINRGREKALHIARVPLAADSDGSSALIALDDEARFVDAAIIDSSAHVIEEWRHFTKGLKHAEIPRLEGAQPRSHLEKLRSETKSKPGADELDEDTQLTGALLRLLSHMNEQASVFNLPREDRELTPTEEFAMVRGEYLAVADLAEELRPLLGASTEEFARIARDSAEAAKGAEKLIAAGDRNGVRAIQKRIMGNCRSCHGLTEHEGTGKLNDAAHARRLELGIGDGFFEIGHDLRIRHPDREGAQAVADALRLGALLIDASGPLRAETGPR